MSIACFLDPCLAYNTWGQRCILFKKDVTGSDHTVSTDALKLARLTIMQFRLLEAIRLSDSDLDGATRFINEQISPKTLELAQIQPVRDCHRVLWRMVGEVLKGKVISRK